MGSARRVSQCRLCRGDLSATVLSLGDQPISNRLPRTHDEALAAGRYPLEVALCGTCGLAQLAHDLDATEHFNDDYVYLSGASSTWVEHCRGYAEGLVARHGVSDRDYVVEVGSNDGTLLKAFRAAGVRGVGVEPSGNVADLARRDGIETRTEFFGPESAATLRQEQGRPRAVIGNNVLAHVPDTHAFLTAARDLIAPDGFLCFEFPHVVRILTHRYFDTIYHEHYAYLGVAPLLHWAQANGMEIYAVEPQPTHGGSLRVFLRHRTGAPTPDAVLAIAAEERALGPEAWRDLSDWLIAWRERFRALLAAYRHDGRKVAGYAAASKATVMLNYLGVGAEEIAFCGDASRFKQGRFIPGAGIPVVAPEALAREQPDVVVAFAWNIFDEIGRVVGGLIDDPVLLVRPLPELEVLPAPQGAAA